MTDFRFNEDAYLEEIRAQIEKTYSEHYAKDGKQAVEFIMDTGHGEGFFIGNIMKYSQRYGKKGTREDYRKDLIKVIHYALLQLYMHDKTDKEELVTWDDTTTVPIRPLKFKHSLRIDKET